MCTHPIGQGGWKPIWPLMNCQIPKNHGPLRLVVTPNPPFFAQEILGGRSNSFGASWIRRNIVLGAQRSEKHLQWVRYNNIYINIPNIYWLGINFDKLLSWKSRNLLVFLGGKGLEESTDLFELFVAILLVQLVAWWDVCCKLQAMHSYLPSSHRSCSGRHVFTWRRILMEATWKNQI